MDAARRMRAMMTPGSLLRIWLAGGIGLVALLAIYEFAPILLPMFVVAGGLWLLTTLIVVLARALERQRGAQSSMRAEE
jgi:hypothetical protein